MWDALFAGMSFVAGDSGRALVLLFTDGFENSSWLPEEQVMQSLKRSNVVVYVVKAKPAERELHALAATRDAERVLETIASQSGGSVFQAESGRRLREQFVGVLNEFRARYLLTYEATGVRRDDGWHTLKVRLKREKGKVQARPGYYALEKR